MSFIDVTIHATHLRRILSTLDFVGDTHTYEGNLIIPEEVYTPTEAL